jgi:hypothetical protein
MLTRVRAAIIRPLAIDGSLPTPIPDGYPLQAIQSIPLTAYVDQGQTVIDRVDGVGVVAIHEEDDTLLGVDLDIITVKVDLVANGIIVGGSGDSAHWETPSIAEQRAQPKRFSLDVYTDAQGGAFLVHRYHYCRGLPRDYTLGVGALSTPGYLVKARPHPVTGRTHSTEFVTALPI